MILGPHPSHFVWATGIEDTFIPQTRPGHRPLDEYELIGHYDHWREDLALARELGVHAIRWGVPWYRVEPQRGSFNWHWTDQVIPYMVEDLGITPIIDLMHYGCPLWMERPFIDDAYPETVAAYAAAFAERYKGFVRWYTPLNEPYVNALMCGKRRRWPPYLRGDRGYVRVMLQLAKGMLATVKAIKHVDPDAIMIHVEAAGLSRASSVDLEALALEEQYRRYLTYDLLSGRVTPEHPLFTWLLHHGAAKDALADIGDQAISLDVLGLNFYPRWSSVQWFLDRRGRRVARMVEKDGASFVALIKQYYQRYQVPIMITETSEYGSDLLRSRWLDCSIRAIKDLRAIGVPVLGYTWFPLYTMIDWSYRTGEAPIANYRMELGLYTLGEDGAKRWHATPLVEQYRTYISDPEAAIGPLNQHASALIHC